MNWSRAVAGDDVGGHEVHGAAEDAVGIGRTARLLCGGRRWRLAGGRLTSVERGRQAEDAGKREPGTDEGEAADSHGLSIDARVRRAAATKAARGSSERPGRRASSSSVRTSRSRCTVAIPASTASGDSQPSGSSRARRSRQAAFTAGSTTAGLDALGQRGILTAQARRDPAAEQLAEQVWTVVGAGWRRRP